MLEPRNMYIRIDRHDHADGQPVAQSKLQAHSTSWSVKHTGQCRVESINRGVWFILGESNVEVVGHVQNKTADQDVLL